MVFQKYKIDTCEPLKKAWKKGELELLAFVRLDYPGSPMPQGALPAINSIGFWDAKQEQNWGLDWHRNEGLEITFLETGSIDFWTKKNQISTLMANSLMITRPWQLHKLGNPNIGPGRLYWIIIDLQVLQPHENWIWPDWIVLSKKDILELTMLLRHNEQAVWNAHGELADLFRQLGKLLANRTNAFEESGLVISINNILLNILQLFRSGRIPLDKSLTDSKRTVQLFLSDLPNNIEIEWSLEKMARHCNLGLTRFTSYCKELTNHTPFNYLNKLRLSAAEAMLIEHPKMSIRDIAYDCGFSSTQYFATQFKKQFKSTPSKYRQKL